MPTPSRSPGSASCPEKRRRRLRFVRCQRRAGAAQEWQASPITSTQRTEGEVSLLRLLDLARDPRAAAAGRHKVNRLDRRRPRRHRNPPSPFAKHAAHARDRQFALRPLADAAADENSRKLPLPVKTELELRRRRSGTLRPQGLSTPTDSTVTCTENRTPRTPLRLMIELIDFGKDYGDFTRRRAAEPEDRGRRAVRLHRPQRRRQEHDDPLSGHAAQGQPRRRDRQRLQRHAATR